MFNFCTNTLFSLLLITFAISCSNDSDEPNTSISDIRTPDLIDDKYEPYVDRFLEEAAQRGLSYDISRLTVVEGVTDPEFCGYGWWDYEGSGNQRIEISEEVWCWDERNDMEREILMFHELGHAILARPHSEANMPIGLPKSMMCSSTCRGFWDTYTLYTPQLRKYYIDELFDQSVFAPEWAAKSTTTEYYKHDFESSIDQDWVFRSVGPKASNFSSSTILLDTTAALNIVSNENIPTPESFAFWRRSFDNPNIPESATIRMMVTYSLNAVADEGVFLVMRADNVEDSEVSVIGFETTQGILDLIGTDDNKTTVVTMPYFPDDVDVLNLYLILSGTGEVNLKSINVEILTD